MTLPVEVTAEAGASFEESLDEILGLARSAGYLNNEAVSAHARAYASRDRKLQNAARRAADAARHAEQAVNSARAISLARALLVTKEIAK